MICILNTTLFEKTLTTGQRKKGGGTDNGSFPTENLVLAVWYSDWKSTAGATVPVKSRGVLGTTRQRGRRRLRTQMVARRAGEGPRQQQGGAQQIYRCNPSDLKAQQHPRPCGLGEQGSLKQKRCTSYPGDPESSKLDGTKRWWENQGLLLFESRSVG